MSPGSSVTQPQFLRHPERLYHSMKRMADGSYRPIPVERAMDEVAAASARLLDELVTAARPRRREHVHA